MPIKNESHLRSLFNEPSERARNKTLKKLEFHSINFINHSPMLFISTIDKNNEMYISPRGGGKGFVKVLDDKTILIPDFKGNNLLETQSNILTNKVIGIIFLIPSVDETLRIRGNAEISDSKSDLILFENEKHPPKTVIKVQINALYLHCAKALMRSEIWNPDSWIERKDFPTMGEMMKDQQNLKEKAETQDEMIKRYKGDI